MERGNRGRVRRNVNHGPRSIGGRRRSGFALAHDLTHQELHANEDSDTLNRGFDRRLRFVSISLRGERGRRTPMPPSFWAPAAAGAGAVGEGILKNVFFEELKSEEDGPRCLLWCCGSERVQELFGRYGRLANHRPGRPRRVAIGKTSGRILRRLPLPAAVEFVCSCYSTPHPPSFSLFNSINSPLHLCSPRGSLGQLSFLSSIDCAPLNHNL